MASPKVSIIMPAFNSSKTIKDAVESVKGQSFENWELIVIDDESTDETASIMNIYVRANSRIKLIKLDKNGGLPNARNQGCLLAKGEYIAFLDSDDLWHKDKLRKQVQFHLTNPEIEISHTDFIAFDNTRFYKRPFRKFADLNEKVRGDLYPSICYKNSIGILTVMVKRELLKRVNMFDTSLWTMEDQDLWIKIAKEKKPFGYIKEVLAYYRISPGGISKRTGKYKRAYKKFLQKITKENNLSENLLLGNYYRHFGTVYFKRSQHYLAKLYFLKSLKLHLFSIAGISTILYLLYNFYRTLFFKPQSKNFLN
jgi:teichuronic acid biosynthesis glycosyltransferase TuaG